MIEKRGDFRDNNFHFHWRIISDFFHHTNHFIHLDLDAR